MNNWIEISEPNLAANYRAVAHAAGPNTEVLAVVKARAYGHGIARCAPVLAAAGARWLGVTSASEGASARQAAGLRTAVLVMCGFLPGDVSVIREHQLTPVIWTAEHVDWLRDASLPVHVEIDTGMARQGVRPGSELAALLQRIAAAGLQLDGLFTHFCSSEQAASPLTQLQQRRFEAAVAQVRDAGLRPRWVHAGNSSSIDNPAQPWPWLVDLARTVGARAMVRAGLALYGYTLPIDLPIEGCAPAHLSLQPVMSWQARMLSVRSLAPGDTVGYNATFTATRPTRIATLAVGYADGLRRELSSSAGQPRGWVMLRGQRAPILGRISMNLTVIDITAIDAVSPGEPATLLGPGITADDHARLANTIAYEILCGIRPCG